MRFSIAGFPVDVHWSFLLVAALLGLQSNDVRIILIWVGVVFVSVLFHELGHAVVARRYGLHPEISLYGMGGLTKYQSGRRLSRARSIAVSLAGPGAGLLLGGIAWGVTQIPMPELNPLGRLALFYLLVVNIFWSILNLLPILPLDGGSVMRSLVHIVKGRADDRLPRQISLVVAVAGGVAGFATGNTFAAIFAAYLGIMNYQALRGLPMPTLPGMRG